ncbi:MULTISPECIES: hypothetical protein [unclassified Bradyrhizobium]|uniref:hypothetical protein n=1 Tax=unclassified Bradyrhizobium TaxID=2631580 RepID=UPI0028EB5D08|nr:MULTISPECIES: hypothetical protein [unclassified Bradyrhizobium]
MAKAPAGKSPSRRGKQTAHGMSRRPRDEATIGRVVPSETRVQAVMRAAERSGLLKDKAGRIGGRVSSALVRQAKRQTGIETDTDLIEFALATIALEDNFAQVFKESRGTVDPKLKLGY